MKVMNVCWSISEQFIDFHFVCACRRYRLCFGSCAQPRMGQIVIAKKKSVAIEHIFVI